MHLTTKHTCSVGYGRSASVSTAVNQALSALGPHRPHFVLVFVGGRHEAALVLETLGQALPDVPLVAGSAAGVITNAGSSYGGFEVGLLAINDPALVPQILATHDLDAGERVSGQRLGQQLRSQAEEGALVVLLYTSVAQQSPLRLHPASEIVGGVLDGLGNRRVHLMGGGLLTDLNLGDAWLALDGTVRRHSAAALVFPPDVAATSWVAHGCRPISDFVEITRIEGAVVYELDGKPALPTLEEMLGLPLAGEGCADLSLIVTLGQKQGDRYAPFVEDAYVNRLILSANRLNGSVTLFEPDFAPGTVVQVMARDNELMLRSARDAAVAASRHVGAKNRCLFALYTDCAGRASLRSGARQEEADVLRQHLDPDIPLFGFYSGVEVAPFQGNPRPLDWTGVLTVVERVQ